MADRFGSATPPPEISTPVAGGTPAGRSPPGPDAARGLAKLAITVGALGVVFGDIGTSPLYALQTAFSLDNGAIRPDEAHVFGLISLVVWAITLIVTVKYVGVVIRADNGGEGGIMALTALVERVRPRLAWLVLLGIFGAALFYGDAVITPAISVLSAVEGLRVAAPGLQQMIVPLTATILVLLFAAQRWGTHRVGGLFGPVMTIWFAVLAAAGLNELARRPSAFRALSPTYAAEFFAREPLLALVAMGAVVLAITGAEALYADVGHFGRGPIRRAWLAIAFPALTLNYLGQGAVVLRDPAAASNPFFLLLPQWARGPMVALATVATVIASQSVISGAFSITSQAVHLGFLPRVTIRHTSAREIGQVYVPSVNWGLLLTVLALVLGFQSSARLAAAYGVAVTGTFVITTLLFLVYARTAWHWPSWRIVVAGTAFLGLELTFLAANVPKIRHGGWVALGIAAVVFTVLSTWRRGREIVSARRRAAEGPLSEFVAELRDPANPVRRVPGTAIFLHPSAETTPLALRANVEHNEVIHSSVVVVSVIEVRVPHVSPSQRVSVDDLGFRDDGITHVTARVGFRDRPAVPQALRLARARGVECDIDVDGGSYFLSHITIEPSRDPGMARWRKHLFVALARNAASPVEYFGLPGNRTVTLGSQIPL